MKSRLVCLLFAIAFCVTQMALAQSVERPRPAGWDRIVPGGRFMDRFEESQPIGPLTSECWGGDNVKPRDVRNGMEEPDYSYWGGNIVYVDGRYHLFVARWKESEPKGHMFWPNSEIAHCVSPRSDGDFKFVEVIGPGHNPELFRCKDGSFAVYCIDSKSQAHVYRSATVNGPWKYERLPLDLNGRKLIEGESNFSFTRRPDGSVLAVCRGGAIWLSEDGIKPFVMMTGRVYPDVAGRFEDPVLWRDEVQYHLVVNDWLGRVAWYLTSPDGFNWTTQPGEAYMPGIARVAGGVTNEWFKYERMRVTTDVYGRVFQANFAVIDCVKREDRGGDNHSSKNITIPVNPGRRVQTFRKTRRGWEMRIMKERGFNPLTDVDVESVIFGSQSMVAFGAGVKPVGTDEANGDLVLIFPLIELDTPVVKALGREKSGRLFFATCRTDGTKLAGDCRFGTGDVAKGPSVPRVRNSDPTSWWMKRHQSKLSEIAINGDKPYDLVLIGDSITHNLEDKPPLAKFFAEAFNGRRALNLGYSGDGVEHLLWRLEHGEADGWKAKAIQLLIGTNNFKEKADDISAAHRRIVELLHARHPEARIILVPVLPRDDRQIADNVPSVSWKFNEVSKSLERLANEKGCVFLDVRGDFLTPDGKVDRKLLPDGLHPNADGYAPWFERLKKYM